MQKTRKERILEALQEEKKNKKSKKFKTGATIAGVTAIATSITVPGIEVIVSADETAPADEASKSAEANTTKETPATATPENTTEPTVEAKQTETKEQTKTAEENQAAAKQVEKAPAEPATVSNPDKQQALLHQLHTTYYKNQHSVREQLFKALSKQSKPLLPKLQQKMTCTHLS